MRISDPLNHFDSYFEKAKSFYSMYLLYAITFKTFSKQIVYCVQESGFKIFNPNVPKWLSIFFFYLNICNKQQKQQQGKGKVINEQLKLCRVLSHTHNRL